MEIQIFKNFNFFRITPKNQTITITIFVNKFEIVHIVLNRGKRNNFKNTDCSQQILKNYSSPTFSYFITYHFYTNCSDSNTMKNWYLWRRISLFVPAKSIHTYTSLCDDAAATTTPKCTSVHTTQIPNYINWIKPHRISIQSAQITLSKDLKKLITKNDLKCLICNEKIFQFKVKLNIRTSRFIVYGNICVF